MSACTYGHIGCPFLAQGPIAQQRGCWSCGMLYQLHMHCTSLCWNAFRDVLTTTTTCVRMDLFCYHLPKPFTLLLMEQCHTCATRMDAHVPVLPLPPQRESARGAVLRARCAVLTAAALGFTVATPLLMLSCLHLSESFCQTFGWPFPCCSCSPSSLSPAFTRWDLLGKGQPKGSGRTGMAKCLVLRGGCAFVSRM